MEITPMLANPEIEPEITINLDTRVITVPPELVDIAVVADDNAEMVVIRVPRYFDGNDFSTRNCKISYNNAANKRGIYTVRNITIEEDSLLLHWHISKFVTVKSGKIYFVVEFKKEIDDRGMSYSWSSLPAEMNVMGGLDDSVEIDERDLSLYQSLLSHINANDLRLSSALEQIYQLQITLAQVLQQITDLDLTSVAYLESEAVVIVEEDEKYEV